MINWYSENHIKNSLDGQKLYDVVCCLNGKRLFTTHPSSEDKIVRWTYLENLIENNTTNYERNLESRINMLEGLLDSIYSEADEILCENGDDLDYETEMAVKKIRGLAEYE